MTRRPLLALLAAAAFATATPPTASPQHAAAPQRPQPPPREAAQYNFLLGEWQLAVKVPPPNLAARIHGMPKLVGTWKAWRGLDGWGVTDELRITDEAGNPMSLSHNVRYYDPARGHWVVSALDVYRRQLSTPTAVWRDGQMHLSSRGTDPQGRAYVSRTRIFAIQPDSFRLQQDRSFDGGKSWDEAALEIEARRTAPAARR